MNKDQVPLRKEKGEKDHSVTHSIPEQLSFRQITKPNQLPLILDQS